MLTGLRTHHRDGMHTVFQRNPFNTQHAVCYMNPGSACLKCHRLLTPAATQCSCTHEMLQALRPHGGGLVGSLCLR